MRQISHYIRISFSLASTCWLSLISLFILFCPSILNAQPNFYILGPGDLINISVYDEADLSFSIRINESGVITYPFIGEIEIVGKTTSEIENSLKEKLIGGEFLLRPDITVNIIEYRPFYIDGEVARPGSYPFEPGLNLRKAISIAGGFTERGSRSKITIETNVESEPTDNSNILDTPIHPDDIITVHERFF